MSDRKKVGSLGWFDLTVENAEEVRDFYKSVVGWTSSDIDMGGYSDFCMNRPEDGETVAGVCHARGGNADLPAKWLMYIVVADLDASIECCKALGGKVIAGPKSMGSDRYCIIADPAGAVCGLYWHGQS